MRPSIIQLNSYTGNEILELQLDLFFKKVFN